MNIDVIILSAGIGKRMKSKEPRSLIDINGDTLIKRQIEEFDKIQELGIKLKYHVATGYKSNKFKKINLDVTVHEIDDYKNCNQIYSIYKILQSIINTDGIFIIHGDILFKTDLSIMDYRSSFTFYDNILKEKEIGMNHTNGLVNLLCYGMNPKWSQMIYLTNNELRMLDKIVPQNKYMLTFEIVNEILNMGGIIRAEQFCGKILEIDKIEDIDVANTNF